MNMNTQILSLSLIIPTSNAHAVLCCVGVCYFTPCLGRKGVRKRMNTEQYREHIAHTFNAFYKIVLYHAALNAYKKNTKKSSRAFAIAGKTAENPVFTVLSRL